MPRFIKIIITVFYLTILYHKFTTRGPQRGTTTTARLLIQIKKKREKDKEIENKNKNKIWKVAFPSRKTCSKTASATPV
jgi:hypothetical protein